VLDLVLDWLRLGAPGLDAIYMVDFIDRRNLVLMALGYHLMFEGPACAAGEFGDDDIAVSEEVDVEINVVYGL